MYNVQIVADSIMSKDHRATSALVTYPRIIHAEMCRHRALSRSSASSRAIPAKIMQKAMESNPFKPDRWMKEHKGMQGTEFFNVDEPYMSPYRESAGVSVLEALQRSIAEKSFTTGQMLDSAWDRAVQNSLDAAEFLTDVGLSKQFTNRLIEPFTWTTELLTGTEWENIFNLRVHPDAEIHFQKIATMMLDAMNASTPKKLKDGEWHVPFGDDIQGKQLWNFMDDNQITGITPQMVGVKIATARSAQTSYTVVGEDGKPMDFLKLINLHDNLLKKGHMSPFEHCMRAMDESEYTILSQRILSFNDDPQLAYKVVSGVCGNVRGFIPYRKMIPGENRTDSRLIKHKYNEI